MTMAMFRILIIINSDICLKVPASVQSDVANAVLANVIFFLPLRRAVWSTVAVNASSSRRQGEFCFRS
jgi:hypothetical protein